MWIDASPRGGGQLAKAIRYEVARLRREQDNADYLASLRAPTPASPPEAQRAGGDALEETPQDASQATTETALVVAAFKRLSDELLHALADNPKLLHGLHWREFEELVADLLSREGLDVRLTPGSRDRGVDIYARHYGPMGATLYVVECKRYGPDKPVGPDLVRLLYGVVERERATKGLLVTSSYFTIEAEREARQELAFRLALRDGASVSDWIKDSTAAPPSQRS